MSTVQPRRAKAVVVGGGVVGSALAYALQQQGWNEIVLIERDRLGCGTTWHSAANIAMLDASSPAYVEFYKRNMDLFRRLQEETGQEVGWRQTGRLQLATNEKRARSLKHIQAVAASHGLAWDWVAPDAVRERLPIMSTQGLVGALWTPTVGRVNPADLVAAYSKAVRAKGGAILEHTPLRAIQRQNGRVVGVETDKGSIESPVVIDSAGLWAPQVAAMVGVALPIHANEHFYVLTRPFEGIYKDMPSFRDADALIYGREEVGGLLLGCFETRAKPLPVESLPADFSFGLLPDDWDQFEPYMTSAIHRIPGLETAEVKILLNGPESFTPDGRFIGGAVPEVPGFYVLAGMNSSGVNNSAGSARALAQLIVHGKSDLDLSPFSPTRFAPFHARKDWLSERISEAPGYLYGYLRPQRDFETGRNLRLGPLHHRLAAAGAQFRSVMGWEHPTGFGDLEGEIAALERGAGLADGSAATRLALDGPGAAALLSERLGGLALAVGACGWAIAPAQRGVESLLLVARLAENRFLLLGEAERETA
ncbi:MAG TPA: FAD-dependent oxidoreductase, partial [Kiloniellales bacterium]|nr:FAD-dependent oxidoreductase [Kiloniellales bacterium]